MEPHSQVRYLIGNLAAVYQPIYGFNEFNDITTRACYDQWQVVQAVADKLRAHLGRPLRVLDISCAQGFFCLNLAAAGDVVFGIDRKPENIALCEELSRALSLKTIFVNDDLITGIARLPYQHFDLLLGFSIFHHICHQLGLEFTRNFIGELSQKAQVCLFEMAVKEEAKDWAAALPKDPRNLLNKFDFVEKLSEHNTRLLKVSRPTYFGSNHYWYVNEILQPFNACITHTESALDGSAYENTRHYYVTDNKILKYFLFTDTQAKSNRDKLEAEISFLKNNSVAIEARPQLLDYKLADHSGWILRDKIPGVLLLTAIAHHLNYNPDAVIENILEQLVRLESIGLYHQDVRPCHVLFSEQGKAVLLAYSAIQKMPSSLLAPKNIYLSFLLFIFEVVNRKTLTVRKLSPMLVRKGSYPARYQNLLQGLLSTNPRQWRFALIAKLFHHQQITTMESMQQAENLQPWLNDMEYSIARRQVKLEAFESCLIKKIPQLKSTEASWFKKVFKHFDAVTG